MAAAIAGIRLFDPSSSLAAVVYLDLNGTTPGFGGAATNTVDLTTTADWTTDVTGVAAPGLYTANAGDGIQIGNVASDFSGDAININMSDANSIGNNPATFNIVSNNVVVTMSGTANSRFNHATTWSIAAGSTMIWTNTGNNNGFNFNSEADTFSGAGLFQFNDAFCANGNAAQTENMSGGAIELNQTATSNFGNSASASFTLTAGTLDFMSTSALADAFAGFTTAGNGGIKINGGTIDNLSGASGTLNLGSAGAYTIGGNFTFTGTSSLSLGNNAVTLTGTRQITVGANTLTIGGAISGTGFGLTKAGNGILALSGTNTYTGATTISQGVLAVNGSLIAASAVGISGGTLAGSGTVNGPVTLTSGGINPGAAGPGSVGTLTLADGLSVNGGTLGFDLGATQPTSDELVVSGAAISFSLASSIAPVGGVAGSAYTLISAGTMSGTAIPTLIQPSNTGTGRYNYAYDPLSYNGSNGKTSIIVDVSGTGPAALTWNNSTGGNGTTWDLANNKNWTSTAATGNPNEFYQGDNVTFNDLLGTSSYTVSLNSAVSPGSVIVNTAGAYVISGTGSIGGTTTPLSMTTSGGGSLTLATANTFGGGVTLNSGTLNINNNTALGTGALTIVSGTLGNTTAGAITAGNAENWNGSFAFNGPEPLTLNGAITLNTNPTVTVNNSTFTIGGIISGTTGHENLIFSTSAPAGNGGVLVLNGASTYTGTTEIQSGLTVTVGNATSLGSAAGGAITVDSGGTLNINGTALNNTTATKMINISGAGVGGLGAIEDVGTAGTANDNVANLTLLAPASVGGALRWDIRSSTGATTLQLNDNQLTKVGANSISLVNTTISSAGGPGNIVVQTGALSLEGTTTTAGGAGGGTITYDSGAPAAFYQNTGGGIVWPMYFLGNNLIGNSGGTVATIPAAINLEGNVTLEPIVQAVGTPNANDPLTLTGQISQIMGTDSVTVNGATTVNLSGTNNWTGGTNLNEGVLQLGSNGALPSGTGMSFGATVSSGTLDVDGRSVSISSLGVAAGAPAGIFTGSGTTVNANATVTFTALPAGVVPGSLVSGPDIPAGTFVVSTTATTAVLSQNASGAATSTLTFSDQVIGNSSITSNSTLTFAGSGVNAFPGLIEDTLGSGTKTMAVVVSSGTLTLSGPNTYSGGTTINGGDLQAGSATALGAATGNLAMSSGTLDLNDNNITVGTLSGTGGTITSNAVGAITLTAGAAANATFAGVIQNGTSGTVAFTKQGTGALTLTGPNTYTGNTNILGGTLAVNNTLYSLGNVNVNASTGTATLAGTGSVGNVTLSGSSNTVTAGTAPNTTGTLTMSSLTASSGANLLFDIGGGVGNTGHDLITMSGAANLNSETVTVSLIPGDTIAQGTYTLLHAGSLTNTSPTDVIPFGTRQSFSIIDNDGSGDIQVVVGAGAADNLFWTGANGPGSPPSWDLKATYNWTDGTNPQQFYNLDNVTFDDTHNGGNYIVALAIPSQGNLQPGSVTVNTTASDPAYTFTGSGSLGGGNVTVMGGGTLVLGTSNNNYAGVTTVAHGLLQLGSSASNPLPTGATLVLGDGTTNSGALDLNGQSPTFSSISTSGTGAVNIIGSSGSASTVNFAGGTSTFAGIIQDGMPSGGTGQLSVNVQSGVLVLTGTNNYTGNTTINGAGATLQLGAGGTSGLLNSLSAINNNGGTLIFDGSDSPTYGNSITGTGSLQQNGTGTVTLSGNLSYGGSTIISSGSLEIAGTNNDTLSGAIGGPGNLIVGDGTHVTSLILQAANGYIGSTTVNAGSTLNLQSTSSIANTSGVTVNGGTMIFANATSTNNFGAGTITIGPGAVLLQYGANALLNALSNPTSIASNGSLTIDIDDSNGTTKDTYVNAGNLSGSGPLTITNSGSDSLDTYTLQGASAAFSGPINIGNGNGSVIRLEVNSATALGTGPVTVFASTSNELWFNTTSTTYTNNISLNGTGSGVDVPSYGAMRLNNGITLTGTITLTANATISGGTAGTNAVTLNGQITGANTLTLMSGTFTLDNTTANASNYGPTPPSGQIATILGTYNNVATQFATVILGNSTSLSQGGLQLQGGVLELNGNNTTVANLSTSGTLTSSAINDNGPAVVGGTATLTIGDGSNQTFGGTLANGTAGGTLALTLTNAVNETFDGSNTYTGATMITNGSTLQIGDGGTNAGSLASAAITVTAASTLDVASNGTIAAATNLTNNGTATFNAPSTTIATLNGTNNSAIVNIGGASTLNISSGGSFPGSIGGNTLAITGGLFTSTSGGQVNTTNLTVSTGGAFTLGSGSSITGGINLTDNGTVTFATSPNSNNIGTLNGTASTATLDLKGTGLQINGGGAYAGAVVDSGSGGTLTVGGSTLTLSGTSTYSGLTTINGGAALVVNGSLAHAGSVADNGGTLAGTGSVGAVTLSGGAIHPGATPADGSIGTLTLASLNDTSGDLRFDLGATTSSRDLISVTGAATFSNSDTISLNFASAPTPGTYTYIVLTAGSSNLSPSTVPTLTTTNIGRSTFSIVNADLSSNEIAIQAVVNAAANLTWNNSSGHGDGMTWDIQNYSGNGLNWTGAGAPYQYYEGDNVTFNDTNNNNYSVNITGGSSGSVVNPGSVTVNTANTYTFTGGTIAGTTGLTKQGTGTLILNNQNTYTGLTSIQNGTLQVANGNAFSSNAPFASISMGDASNHNSLLDLDGNTVNVGSLATVGGGTAIIGSSSSSSTLNFYGGTSTFGGVIADTTAGATNSSSATTLNVQSGTLVLTGANTYSGPTTIGNGTNASALQIGNGTSGNLLGGGTVQIQTNSSLVLDTNQNITFTGAINGPGSLQQNGTGTTILANNNSYGNTSIGAGTLQVGTGSTTGSLGSGTTISNNGALVYDVNNTATLSTVISGTGSFTQMGGGALTLSGVNTYTGATNITSGSVVVTNSASLGTISGAAIGAVNINGGTLDLTGAAAGINFGTKQFNIQGTGLNGLGAIVNTGVVLDQSPGAIQQLALTGNASIGGTIRWDIGRGTTTTDTLNLNGYTLTKVNPAGSATSNQISIVATTINGPGTIVNNSTGDLSLETSTVTVGTGSLVYDTGTWAGFYENATSVNNTVGITWPITFMGGNTMGDEGGTVATILSPIILEGNLTLETLNGGTPTVAANDPLALYGTISDTPGTSSITVNQNTIATLYGTGNNWGGGTTIVAGTLQTGSTSALPSSGTITFTGPSGTALTDAVLDIFGQSISIGALASTSGNGEVLNNGTVAATLTTTGTGAFSGVIANGTSTTALTVASGGLTLSGVNTYTGNTNINGGTLFLVSPGSIALANINIASSGTFDVSNYGGGGYTILATQTVLANGAINGTLNLNGTLTGTGAATGANVTMNAGSFIKPGASAADGNIGTLGIASLNATAGGTLRFDLGGAASDVVNVAGAASFSSSASLTVNLTSAPTLSKYTVLSTTSGITGLPTLGTGTSLTLGRTTVSYDSLTTGPSPTAIILDVLGAPANLTWNNAAAGDGVTWDVQTNNNWQSSPAPAVGSPNQFYQFDNVTFNDSLGTSSYAVTLSNAITPLTPLSVTVNTNNPYSFNGSGSIGGNTGLTMSSLGGTGSLTINNTNSYVGTTTINSGTLTANAASALGSGPIVLNSPGTLNIDNAAFATGPITINGGTLGNNTSGTVVVTTANTQSWAGSFAFAGPIALSLGTGAVTLNSNPTITVNTSTLTVGGVISNGSGNSLTVAGAGGTLALTANSTYSGGATVNSGGVLQVSGSGGNTALGSGNPTVNSGGTLIGAVADAFGFEPDTAPATININGGTVTEVATGAYRITFPNVTFTNGGTLATMGDAGDANGNYSFFGNGTTATVSSTGGPTDTTTAVISASVSLEKPTVFNITAGNTPSGVDLLVSGPIVPNGTEAFTKSGTGTMELAGANTYVGATAINQGKLILATTGTLPDTAITVGNGTTTGTLEIAANTSPTAGFLTRNVTSLAVTSTGTVNLDNATASASPAVNTNRSVLVVAASSAVPPVSTLSIAAGGTLNLGSNDMLVHSGSIGESVAATLTTAAAQGFNGVGGAWTGTGLTTSAGTKANNPNSNTALAIVVNDTNQSGTLSGTQLLSSSSPFNNHLTTFDGQTVADGDVMVKYTYFGDALLTGSVIAADYTQIDAGFASQSTATPLTGWFNGDFNYDGKINGDDYALIDNAFNTQGTTSYQGVSAGPTEMIATDTDQIAAPSASSSSVPEPTTLGMLSIGAIGLLSRRRRRVR